MKVYLSGSYVCKAHVRELAAKIVKAIPRVKFTSDWVRQDDEDCADRESAQEFINKDVEGVEGCDVFVFLNTHPYARPESPGKWVELGIAMGSRKPIIVFGDQRHSMFLWDEYVVQVEGILEERLIETLTAYEAYHFWKSRGTE